MVAGVARFPAVPAEGVAAAECRGEALGGESGGREDVRGREEDGAVVDENLGVCESVESGVGKSGWEVRWNPGAGGCGGGTGVWRRESMGGPRG